MGFIGLKLVLTIIAHGYMFRDDSPDIDYIRRAICAWYNIPDKKLPLRRRSGNSGVISATCIGSFSNWSIQRDMAGFIETFTKSRGSSPRIAKQRARLYLLG